ncbi:MAG: MFS transporter [Christensenellales bacterium]|mgnify:CR=1 FL=1|jgi:oligogalacturonide transporter|nr:MFS transporter [Clostridiales bacterium]
MSKLKSKLAYACGDIYGGGAFLIFSLLYMNFLVLVEGLPVLATTLIILIGKVWDAVTDPIMGRISDRTRSRFGRRRIYFLAGIVPVFLSFVMLFYSFGIQSVTAKIVYHAFAYMFFGTAFTVVMVPYNAILSDMTDDYNERTSYTTVRMCFSGGTSLLAAVLPGLIINAIGGEKISSAQKSGYLVMALVFGLIFGLCWLLAFLGTKEKEDLPPVLNITFKDVKSVFKLKPYLNFLGIFLFFQVCVDIVLALFIFYIDIVVLQYKNYTLVMGALLVSQLIFMIVNGEIAKRKSKAFPLFIGIPLWIIVTLLFAFVNSATPLVIICVFAVLIGYGAAAGNLATWSMLTDIYDLDECVSSERREGVYSGITTFLRKVASGVSILILGFGLEALGFNQNEYNIQKSYADFDPATYAQSDLVKGIKRIFIIVPVVLLTGCLIFALANKINKKRFDAVIKAIDSFKEKGDLSKLGEEEIQDVERATGVKRENLWQKV